MKLEQAILTAGRRMSGSSGGGSGGGGGGPTPANVDIYGPGEVTEGQNVTFAINRRGDTSGTSSVDWELTGLAASDFDSPASGKAEFGPGDQVKSGSVSTVAKTGVQTGRQGTVTLLRPVGCLIAPGGYAFQFMVNDDPAYNPPPTGSWDVPTLTGNSPQNPPYPSRELRVPEDYANINAALAVAQPGEAVSLANGNHAAFNATRPGAANRWIQIRARNRGMAVLTGKNYIRAPYYWIHGCKYTFNGDDNWRGDNIYPITIQASNVLVTRGWFDSYSYIQVDTDGRTLSNITINWNSFLGVSPTSYRIVGGLFVGEVAGTAKAPANTEIAYNRWHDPTNSSQEGRKYYYIGDSKPGNNPTGVELTHMFHHNYQTGCRNRQAYMKRHIYCAFNVLLSDLGPGAGNFGFRHGGGDPLKGGIIEGNYISKSTTQVNDTGAILRGNKYVGNSRIELYCGAHQTNQPGVNPYQAASDTLLVANDQPGVIEIGHINENKVFAEEEGGKVKRVRIYRGGFNPVIERNPVGADANGYTAYNGDGGYWAPTPIVPADLLPLVGYNAPALQIPKIVILNIPTA